MPIIDSDAHIDETDETWDFLLPEHTKFRPTTILPGDGPSDKMRSGKLLPGYDRYWNIGGVLKVRRIRDDQRTGTTEETRELRDVPARLAQMDELGIDVQVLYPTLFLGSVSTNPEIEYALARSYNRWMGARSDESHGRLRWVLIPPIMSLELVEEEIAYGSQHGACGVLKKGLEAGGLPAGHEYFDRLYQCASDAGLPVCVHIGTGDPAFLDPTVSQPPVALHRLPPIDAFISLVLERTPDKFPDLRVGFIEALSSWVPFAVAELRSRAERIPWLNLDFSPTVVQDSRFYIACQTQEDIPYIATYSGAANLVIGTDYGHADQSAEINALSVLKEQAKQGALEISLADRIIGPNASALYGIH